MYMVKHRLVPSSVGCSNSPFTTHLYSFAIHVKTCFIFFASKPDAISCLAGRDGGWWFVLYRLETTMTHTSPALDWHGVPPGHASIVVLLKTLL